MEKLKYLLIHDDQEAFVNYATKTDILNKDEVLMFIYVAVVCMNSQTVLQHLLTANNFFQANDEWYTLFTHPNLKEQLQKYGGSAERNKLDLMVLKTSLDNELIFMSDLVIDRSVFTHDMIVLLLKESKYKLLVSLISKPVRPIYQPPHRTSTEELVNPMSLERELHFKDIVNSALDSDEKYNTIIHLIKLMK